jgi:hypothetical protein
VKELFDWIWDTCYRLTDAAIANKYLN